MTDSPTKARLIEAARELFLQHGFAATSVSAILTKAGVRSGSLYHFFASKDELLVAVLGQYIELLRPIILDPVEAATDDPIERVFLLLARYRAFLELTGCNQGCPIGNLALEISDRHEAARELVRRNFDNWCAGVEEWLVAAGDRLPADVDRRALSRFVLTVMEGAQMQAKAQKGLEGYDASIGQLRDYFRRMERG
jgi:AcrR family transcriptional regulator